MTVRNSHRLMIGNMIHWKMDESLTMFSVTEIPGMDPEVGNRDDRTMKLLIVHPCASIVQLGYNLYKLQVQYVQKIVLLYNRLKQA